MNIFVSSHTWDRMHVFFRNLSSFSHCGLQVSILSERRVHAPRGAHGGENGQRGSNLLFKSNGRVLYLGGMELCRCQISWSQPLLFNLQRRKQQHNFIPDFYSLFLSFVWFLGKNTFEAESGDLLQIQTPGGGGWGQLASSWFITCHCHSPLSSSTFCSWIAYPRKSSRDQMF